jgi:uncharacterized protein YjiS (DUF1127 family)
VETIIMSTIFWPPATMRVAAGQSHSARLGAALRRMGVAYINWRLEEAVINHLWSMNDRDLKDIGLTRSEITSTVKGDLTRDRTFRRDR